MITKNENFSSEDLVFDGISQNDTDWIVKWRSNMDTIQYFLNPVPVTKEKHLKWLEQYFNQCDRYDFMIRTKQTGAPIGIVGISNIDLTASQCEINYVIGEGDYRGRGYATQAINALMNFAQTVFNIREFVAEIHQKNQPSLNLIKKFGFQEEMVKDEFVHFRLKKKHLFFRADGNFEIGTGHIMRCLSIACAASKKGVNSTFVVADTSMQKMIEDKGYSVICLNSAWNNLDREVSSMKDLIAKEKIQHLFVDSYFVTPNYMQQLSSLTSLTYLDDLLSQVYDCARIVNYNCYATTLGYEQSYDSKKTKLLLGPQFAPLREEFARLPAHSCKEVATDILITTGGADKFNMAGKIAETLVKKYQIKHINLHIIAGKFNLHLDFLNQLALKFKNIIIHCEIDNISSIMKHCDLAISAGGSTIYELCACGTPTVMFAMADNQIIAYQEITKSVLIPGGNAMDDLKGCVDTTASQVFLLLNDAKKREELSRNMQKLVDGKGATRLVEAVLG